MGLQEVAILAKTRKRWVIFANSCRKAFQAQRTAGKNVLRQELVQHFPGMTRQPCGRCGWVEGIDSSRRWNQRDSKWGFLCRVGILGCVRIFLLLWEGFEQKSNLTYIFIESLQLPCWKTLWLVFSSSLYRRGFQIGLMRDNGVTDHHGEKYRIWDIFFKGVLERFAHGWTWDVGEGVKHGFFGLSPWMVEAATYQDGKIVGEDLERNTVCEQTLMVL